MLRTAARGDMVGENLDISSEPPEPPSAERSTPRPFLGIHFACCDIYARVYQNREATAYEGRCPRCLRRVEVLIGPGGSDARFFRAE